MVELRREITEQIRIFRELRQKITE